MTDLVLSILAWIVILFAVERGFRQVETIDHFAVQTWAIFIAIGLVFTFKTPLVAQGINHWCGGYPVAYWLKTLATLAAVLCYSISLREFTAHEPTLARLSVYHRYLIRAAWIVVGIITALLVANVRHGLSYLQARFAIKWVLEGYMLLHITLVFIPVNRMVLRREQVAPMRVKHIATLVLIVTYALSAVIALITVPPIIVTGQLNPGPQLVPRHMIGLACLLVMLVPHRWVVICRLPGQVRRYVRVAAVEREIAVRAPFRREPRRWWTMLHPRYPEMATYITVINILDNYQRLDMNDPVSSALYRKLAALIPANPDYDDLVRALSQVTL